MENKIVSPQISTLIAEINIIKIGNKQMTVSVFKQLYEQPFYDDNFNIIYPIWGIVKREGSYFVVFQVDSQLFKYIHPFGKIENRDSSYLNRIYESNYNAYRILKNDFNLMYVKWNNMTDELKTYPHLFIAL